MGLTNNKQDQTVDTTNGGAPAGTGTGAGAAPAGTGENKEKTANEVLKAKGQAIISGMTEEEREALGNKSATLKFVRLLGLGSQRSNRRVNKDETADCATPVGIVFTSTEPIRVPVIDILKNHQTGITAEDVSYVDVPADTEFTVSYMEYMLLITRPEYSGLCWANGDDNGAFFAAKAPAYLKNKAKLPTPTINFRTGSVKASIHNVDEKNAAGRWVIKPEHAEKFGALMKAVKPSRSGGTKKAVASPVLVSAAIHNLIGIPAPVAAPAAPAAEKGKKADK